MDMGADDYVIKPFFPSELVARVKAVLRRYGKGNSSKDGNQELTEIIKTGDIQMDLRQHLVVVREKEGANPEGVRPVKNISFIPGANIYQGLLIQIRLGQRVFRW